MYIFHIPRKILFIYMVYTKFIQRLYCIMFTCLNTDRFEMIFIVSLQKFKSLFMEDTVLGNIAFSGCVCDCFVHTCQVSYLLQINVYPLFTCMTFILVIKTLSNAFKIVFSLVWEARMFA